MFREPLTKVLFPGRGGGTRLVLSCERASYIRHARGLPV